ncbi:MAG: PQQ-like beta-propeller repeat protein [Planctomycetes bacterium]|nr:PQQ-like beta-propeller repeat protein [Planctomycetota bacterium]
MLVREDVRYSNSAFVRTSDETEGDLFAGDLKLESGDESAAFSAWQRVLDRGDVAADGTSALVNFRARTYLSGSEAVARRLAALPDAARQRYCDRFADRANAAVAAARAALDVAALFDVARRYPITPAASTALRLAAALSLERGDGAQALRATQALAARGAASTADVLMHARALEANDDVVGVARLRADVAARDAEPIQVAGAPSTLGAQLDLLLENARKPEPFSLTGRSPQIFVQVPLRFLRRDGDDDPRGARPPEFPSSGLVRIADRIVVPGQESVFALDVNGRETPARADYTDLIGPGFDPETEEIADRSLEPVTDGTHAYLTVTRRALAFADPAPTHSYLFALRPDLSVAWRVDVDATPELAAYAGFVFEGPPAVYGELVVVSASRLSSVTECAVFAFDRRSGALRWQRFVASATAIARYAGRNQMSTEQRVRPAPILVGGGDAYCVTNLGVVASLDALTGTIRWAYKTNRIDPQDDSFQRDRYFDTGGWAHGRPVLVGSKLVVTPEDARFAYVLAREPSREGYLVLNEPAFKADRDVLVGADPSSETLYFLRRAVVGPLRDAIALCATNLDGVTLWSTAELEVEERTAGRPMVVDDTILMPTTKALYAFRAADGVALEVFSPPGALARDRLGMAFGNLVRDGRDVWSVSPRFVLRMLPNP